MFMQLIAIEPGEGGSTGSTELELLPHAESIKAIAIDMNNCCFMIISPYMIFAHSIS